MKYREINPTEFLKNFVECFWYYKTTNSDIQHTILPDGYFDLIAEFEKDKLTIVKLTGVWTEPKNVLITKNTTFFAIRFKLLAVEYLFQKEIKSILNATLNLPFDFWNMNSYNSFEFEKFVSTTTNYIEGSLKYLKEIDNRKLNLFELIYQLEIKTVTELSQKIYWSSRQINRYFNAQFGFSLKAFLKIVRCNASYKNISQGQLSPQQDYFDQSHFIKDLKKYTGTTPKELHKKNDRFLQISKKELR